MRCYPKINIFFKITNLLNNGYCEIYSRYRLINNIYDEIDVFTDNHFSLECNVNIKDNLILKARDLLIKFTNNPINVKVILNKSIPIGSGLGGGSSNAALFILEINKLLNLKLNINDLFNIGATLGSDINFFISKFNAANVYGYGDKIMEFNEENMEFNLTYPPFSCSTEAVFNAFKSNPTFSKIEDVNILKNMKSKDILKSYSPIFLNDLFIPATKVYPSLNSYHDNNLFLSGSGSTLFTPKV